MTAEKLLPFEMPQYSPRMPRPHRSDSPSPLTSGNAIVFQYGDLFHPFPSLKVVSHSVTAEKTYPFEIPQYSPAIPRPHMSSLASPLISGNLIVFQYGDLFHPFPSLKLSSHTVAAEKAVPLDTPQYSPAIPRPHTSALPSPFTSANWMLFQ